jgi:dodecin
MDRYARWWLLLPATNICSRAMIRKATPKTRVSPGAAPGRGYGPLSMRLQRPAADMFSLSLQVVGKNVSSSSERASEKGVTQEDMSVARVTEISALSDTSFEDAIQQGIARATKTLRNVEGAWVKDQNLMIEDGNIKGYKVNLEVTFVLEE